MSYQLDDIKRQQKKMNRTHKKIMKKIAKEMDYTDQMEVEAFGYLQLVNSQFDDIVDYLDKQEKTNKTN